MAEAGAAAPALGAGFEVELGLGLTQRHVLAPMAAQVLALLRLPQAALDDVLAARIAENPLLHRDAVRRCQWCASRLRGGRCRTCAGAGSTAAHLAHDPVAPESDLERLRADARTLLPIGGSPEVERAVDAVIASLDDRGLLAAADDDLASLADAIGVDARAMTTAIDAIRTAGPPGIAAPSATACLLAQAEWHAARGAPAALVGVVARHLPDVAAGDHRAIAGVLGCPIADVDDAVAFLRRHLRPFVVFDADAVGASEPAPPPPDVIVRRDPRDETTLVVDVLGSRDIGLVIDTELLDAGRATEASAWMDRHLSSGRALLEAVDRRAATLRRIAQAIVVAQHRFVVGGPREHRPLTRTAGAGALGLNVSTVSRAVDGKVARLPDGRLLPLAAFFEPAVAVKAALARLIGSEETPRSDAYLADRLAAEGYPVARRTVAKYRRAITRI